MAPGERINLQVLCLTGKGLTLSILLANCSIGELEPSILSIGKIAISEPVLKHREGQQLLARMSFLSLLATAVLTCLLLYAFRLAHFVLVCSFIIFERGAQLVLHQILFGVTLPGDLRNLAFRDRFSMV